MSSLYFYDFDNVICHSCPIDCKCDVTGCYFCSASTLRLISTNSVGVKVCNCDSSNYASEDASGKCKCNLPYVLNTATNICECK